MRGREAQEQTLYTILYFVPFPASQLVLWNPKKEHSRNNFDLAFEGNMKDLSRSFPANCSQNWTLQI